MNQLQDLLSAAATGSTSKSLESFALLANVLGMQIQGQGAETCHANKPGMPEKEVLTLSLAGGGESGVLRAEHRRGSSSVFITSAATEDGAYGIFCQLAVKLAEPVKQHVKVLNWVNDSGIDPADVVTCIRYLYRDADNYKQSEVARFPGPAGIDSLNAFLAMLESSDGTPSIIPGQIGLYDLQDRFTNGWSNDSDHPFHSVPTVEFVDINVMSEAEAATVFEQSFDDFVKAMFIALGGDGGWDQSYRPECAQQSADAAVPV